MKKARTPNSIQRITYAKDLEHLAEFLISARCGEAMKVIADMLDAGYPTTASGAGGDGGGHSSDISRPTERLAAQKDRELDEAESLVIELWRHQKAAQDLYGRLVGYTRDRHIPKCDACEFPTSTDGRCPNDLCPRKEWPDCIDCADPMAPGDRRDRKHNACRMYYERHGYTKAGASKYQAEMANILTEDGTFVGE